LYHSMRIQPVFLQRTSLNRPVLAEGWPKTSDISLNVLRSLQHSAALRNVVHHCLELNFMWSKGNMGGVPGWCFLSIDVYTWRPSRIYCSSILVWTWPSLISSVIGTKTVFLTFSICFHLSYATNYMTIHFVRSCLSGNRRSFLLLLLAFLCVLSL
jgi:hypothetical protein